MSTFLDKLNMQLGFEDEAPNVQVNIDVDETGMPLDNVTEEGVNTPEADEVEVIEEAAEIEADNEVMEEMTEATDSLESIYIAMESAQLNGGLTQEAAQFASIAVGQVVGKYGASAADVGVSLESFGDNRSHATTVSMEGIKETLKNLWDTIVKKFHEMVKKITDFFNQHLSRYAQLKTRAEGIAKKAKATTGTAKESTFADKGLFNALNVSGTAPTAATIQNGLKATAQRYKENLSADAIESVASKNFSAAIFSNPKAAATSILGTMVGNPAVKIEETNGVYGITGARVSVPAGFTPNTTSDFTTFRVVPDLPGNKTWWMGAINDATATRTPGKALGSVQAGMYTQNPKVKKASGDDAAKLPVLSLQQVDDICSSISVSMGNVVATKVQNNKKLNGVKVLEKAGNKLIEEIGASKSDTVADANALLNGSVTIARRIDAGNAALLAYNYTLSKAALAYCSRSLSQYKTEKKD